jgi:hypothetical protein
LDQLVHLWALQVVGKRVVPTAAEETNGGGRLVHPRGSGPGVADGFDPGICNMEWEFFCFGKKVGPRNAFGGNAESSEGAGDSLKNRAPRVRRYHGIMDVPVDGFLEVFRRNVFGREGTVYVPEGRGPPEEKGRLVQPQAAEVVGWEAVVQALEEESGRCRVEVVGPGQRVVQVKEGAQVAGAGGLR